MSLAAAFPRDTQDSCGNFFGTALRAFNPTLPVDAKVLEIGCAEFNWLDIAATAWPTMHVVGVDWRRLKRPPRAHAFAIRADVRDDSLFPDGSFDWIVSISAIEHVGLGHYDRDPVDEWGDRRAVVNAWAWLKPGGWFYFDVPWNAGEGQYAVCGTSHRRYDDATLIERFGIGTHWREAWRGVASPGHCDVLLTDPPQLETNPERFYYVGLWLQKVQ